MNSDPASDEKALKAMIKNWYSLLYVDKLDLQERLQASRNHVLSQEIERMLEEEDGQQQAAGSAAATDPLTLPPIRVLPLTDQLNSLEKSLTAYSTILSRCIANLQTRIRNFRFNDSCIPDHEQ